MPAGGGLAGGKPAPLDHCPDVLPGFMKPAAIVNARQKIAEGKPLGFDIEPLIETVRKRQP